MRMMRIQTKTEDEYESGGGMRIVGSSKKADGRKGMIYKQVMRREDVPRKKRHVRGLRRRASKGIQTEGGYAEAERGLST